MFLKTFFFGEHLRLYPWSLAFASSNPVLGLERVCPRKGCPWPRVFFVSLASSLMFSTPPLFESNSLRYCIRRADDDKQVKFGYQTL